MKLGRAPTTLMIFNKVHLLVLDFISAEHAANNPKGEILLKNGEGCFTSFSNGREY
jgi:hypothetical protein